jgi:hypothetical protein
MEETYGKPRRRRLVTYWKTSTKEEIAGNTMRKKNCGKKGEVGNFLSLSLYINESDVSSRRRRSKMAVLFG